MNDNEQDTAIHVAGSLISQISRFEGNNSYDGRE